MMEIPSRARAFKFGKWSTHIGNGQGYVLWIAITFWDILDWLDPKFSIVILRNGNSQRTSVRHTWEILPLRIIMIYSYMELSWNRGTLKSSILMGVSLQTNHFWDTPMTMEPPIVNIARSGCRTSGSGTKTATILADWEPMLWDMAQIHQNPMFPPKKKKCGILWEYH